jgi:hypothetical protein
LPVCGLAGSARGVTEKSLPQDYDRLFIFRLTYKRLMFLLTTLRVVNSAANIRLKENFSYFTLFGCKETYFEITMQLFS